MLDLRWKRAYGAFLLGLIALNFAGNFLAGLYQATRPYELDYGEGIVVHQASLITDRNFAYGPIDRYPYVVFHYPPMFHLASRAVATLNGNLLLSGRLVSWVSGMTICGLIALILFLSLPRRIGHDVRLTLALFAATLPFGYYNFFWTWLARTDNLAIAFAFAAITLLLTLRSSLLHDALIATLLVASLFTKQISVAAIAACLLSTLLLDRARFVRLFLAMLLLGGAALVGLAWVTEGRILSHLFFYNQNPYKLSHAVGESMRNLSRMRVMVSMAAAAAFYALYRWKQVGRRGGWNKLIEYVRVSRLRRSTLLFVLYSFFAALVTLAVGKEGSSVNYFLEWNLTLAPLSALAILRWLPPLRATRLSPVHAFALILMPCLLMIAPADNGWADRTRDLSYNDAESTRVLNSMVGLLKQTPGAVLSEDMTLLNLAGKEVPAEPAIIQSLAASKIWNDEPFLKMIHEQRFSLIVATDISNRMRWSPRVVQAIEGAYTLNRTMGRYQIYAPSTLAQAP